MRNYKQCPLMVAADSLTQGNYPVLNWKIAYELIQVGLLTSVCVSSLKLDGIARGLMDDICVLKFLNHTTKLFNEP